MNATSSATAAAATPARANAMREEEGPPRRTSDSRDAAFALPGKRPHLRYPQAGMNDTQILALASVPTMLAVLVGILISDSRLTDLRIHVGGRFDEMRDLWRAELRRVEEVIDARLKHLEERG